jgi:hypothetical protein
MTKDRFKGSANRDKPKDDIKPLRPRQKGGWTNRKREPVRIYTPEKIEEFEKERGWK